MPAKTVAHLISAKARNKNNGKNQEPLKILQNLLRNKGSTLEGVNIICGDTNTCIMGHPQNGQGIDKVILLLGRYWVTMFGYIQERIQ